MQRRTLITLAGTGSATLAMPSAGRAATYPARPIRFVVPFPPGGSTDLVARLAGERLNAALGVPVIVDNKPGASGMIAGGYAYNAPPDGYVIFIANNQVYNNPALYRKVPYKPDEFEPVALIYTNPIVFVVAKGVPTTDARSFIEYAKSRPGMVNYASLGSGSTAHLIALRMERMFGLKLVHVPYKGSAEADQALIAGDVQLYFDAPATALPFVKSGAIKLLAVLSEQRVSIFPDTPTMIEGGMDISATPWAGAVAPPGTPAPVVKALSKAIGGVMSDPNLQAKLLQVGLIPQVLPSPGAFRNFIEKERAGWEALINDVGLKLD